MAKMRSLKRITVLLFAVVPLGALFLTGCESQQKKNEKAIVGRWKLKSKPWDYTFEFLSNGEYRINEGEIGGSYVIEDDYITLKFTLSEYRYKFEMKGNTLSLIRNGEAVTYKRVV